MALDRALLDLARSGATTLRLYRWNPPCLSFGRHEPALRRYDRARITALGIDTVRRPTGGRAVWHATELTYAFAAPADEHGSLADAYLSVHEMLAAALGLLGASVSLAVDGHGALALDAGACFASPVGGEVMAGDRKMVGSAQLRSDGALLQHGSLLLSGDQSVVAAVSRGEPPPGSEAALDVALGRPVEFGEAAEAVAHAAECWRPGWLRETVASRFLSAASVHEALFRSDAWTWRR